MTCSKELCPDYYTEILEILAFFFFLRETKSARRRRGREKGKRDSSKLCSVSTESDADLDLMN